MQVTNLSILRYFIVSVTLSIFSIFVLSFIIALEESIINILITSSMSTAIFFFVLISVVSEDTLRYICARLAISSSISLIYFARASSIVYSSIELTKIISWSFLEKRFDLIFVFLTLSISYIMRYIIHLNITYHLANFTEHRQFIPVLLILIAHFVVDYIIYFLQLSLNNKSDVIIWSIVISVGFFAAISSIIVGWKKSIHFY